MTTGQQDNRTRRQQDESPAVFPARRDLQLGEWSVVLHHLYSAPYISPSSRRKAAASRAESEPSLFPSRLLPTARIWSAAVSAGLPLILTFNRVRQSGCSRVVRGHTTTVSKARLRASRLTITAGRVLQIGGRLFR